MKDKNNIFKILIIIGVLVIPFMYSFFYLKAYWNPYGEGNIDNLPVAIVNEDSGEKGKEIIKSIKDSKKLKISELSNKKAETGLNEGEFYAVITIPSDFTDSLQSVSTNEKKHPTITYSPNQKSNYLASQIINSVVTEVEKKLNNSINSEIVGTLSTNVEKVPMDLKVLSDGLKQIKNGTNNLSNGTNTLVSNYNVLNSGINTLSIGANTLVSGLGDFNKGIEKASLGSNEINTKLKKSIDDLKNQPVMDEKTLNMIKNMSYKGVQEKFTEEYKNSIGMQSVSTVKQTYINNMSAIEQGIEQATSGNIPASSVKNYCLSSEVFDSLKSYCDQYNGLSSLVSQLNDSNSILYQTIASTAISSAQSSAEQTALNVSEEVAKQVAETSKNKTLNSLETLSKGIDELNNGLNTLNQGSNKLYIGGNDLYNGAIKLSDGSNKINLGISKLDSGAFLLNDGVSSANSKLDDNILLSNKKINTLNGLKKYSENPVQIKKQPSNEVDAYGVSFGPLFISIALWVGCLMLFIVLYYDKNQRFKLLGIDNQNRYQRTILYHVLATIMAIILGVLLQLLLNFDITNVCLYYVSLIIISNCFLAIIQFLIGIFGDVGKFLALIVLVLQLAASGGTFPIETVTKGFRFLNPMLPMTYTIKLIKESIMSIERELLYKNLIVIVLIMIVFVIINVIVDIYKSKKIKK